MTSWPWLPDLVRSHQLSPVPGDVVSIERWLRSRGWATLSIDAPDSVTRGGDAYLQICRPTADTARLDAYLEDPDVGRVESERVRVAAMPSTVLGPPSLVARDLAGLEWADGRNRVRLEQRTVEVSKPPRCACMTGVVLPSMVRVTFERMGGCGT